MKKTTLQIVRLPNGKYVEDWQYSQGNFDVVETSDINKACEVDNENFMVFFMDKGARLVSATFSVDIVPMSDVELSKMKEKMAEARKKQKEEGKRLGKNKAIYDYL